MYQCSLFKDALLPKNILFIFLGIFLNSLAFSHNNISLFPIEHYDQDVNHWLNPTLADYHKPLLTSKMQAERHQEYLRHFYSPKPDGQSPWSAHFVNTFLFGKSGEDLQSTEKKLIAFFSNAGKDEQHIGYGSNFRPYPQQWIDAIADNMNLAQFLAPQSYDPTRRGITVDNLMVRILPTDDPHYYHYQFAGQGYPFDNLQNTAIWAGTPVYIFGESSDHNWLLILADSYMGWVKATGVAKADENFISNWYAAAQHKLAAIIKTQLILQDNYTPLLTAYIGTVLPATAVQADSITLLLPIRMQNGFASSRKVQVAPADVAIMPWQATPEHFALLIQQLIGRPYGWGNYNFYNDCSAEIKSLYTPFSIWLTRHSTEQIEQGKSIDLSSQTLDARLTYLTTHAHKLMTIVYIGGHVFLYTDKYPSPDNKTSIAMTYQSLWGLSPADNSRRSIIGKSVFFPLLSQYPEDVSLRSLADKKYFKLAFLDEMPRKLFKWTIPNLLYFANPYIDEQIR